MSPALTAMREANVAVPACATLCGSLDCTPVYEPVPAERRARSARPVAADPLLTRQRTTTPSNGATALGAPLVLSPVNAVHGVAQGTAVADFARSEPTVVTACAAAAGPSAARTVAIARRRRIVSPRPPPGRSPPCSPRA